MIKIKPFGHQILVKPIEKKQVLVSEQKSFCSYGEVIAVGQNVSEIKVGDTIGFTVWGLNSLEIENEKFYFVLEESQFVLGIVLPDELPAQV